MTAVVLKVVSLNDTVMALEEKAKTNAVLEDVVSDDKARQALRFIEEGAVRARICSRGDPRKFLVQRDPRAIEVDDLAGPRDLVEQVNTLHTEFEIVGDREEDRR